MQLDGGLPPKEDELGVPLDGDPVVASLIYPPLCPSHTYPWDPGWIKPSQHEEPNPELLEEIHRMIREGVSWTTTKPSDLVDPLVNHPPHYTGLPVRVTGADGVEITADLECIDLIEALGCGFHLANAQKYLFRAARADGRAKGAVEEDLKKAVWYIQRYLCNS